MDRPCKTKLVERRVVSPLERSLRRGAREDGLELHPSDLRFGLERGVDDGQVL